MCIFFSYIYYYYCKFIANIALLTEKPLNEGTGVYCIVWYGIVTILTHFKIERSQLELLPISETSFSLACWFFCLIRMSKFSTENFKVVFMEEFKHHSTFSAIDRKASKIWSICFSSSYNSTADLSRFLSFL